MVTGNQPDWLPPEWIEVKDKSGQKVKYYRNTETGQTFFSKEDVTRYISMGNICNRLPEPVDKDNEMDEDNELHEETKTVLVTSVKIPEWLPRGWTVELRRRDNGPLIKCYLHCESGRRCYSKPQVFRYLETVNGSPATEEGPIVVCETGEKSSSSPLVSDASPRDGVPRWLPQGWTMEVQVRGSGITEGKKFKVYIAPGSGRKFFSKPKVLEYLKTLNSNPAGDERPIVVCETGEKSSSSPPVSDGSQRDGVPEWLPQGWTMEIKVRGSGITEGMKTKVYIAPDGCKFFSKPKVFEYLKTLNSNPAGDERPTLVRETGDKSSPGRGADQRNEDVPEWLPQGWTMQMNVVGSGQSEGKKYKCFIAPDSGHKCYSKQQVFDYLKTKKNRCAGEKSQTNGGECSLEPVASGDRKSISTRPSISKSKKSGDSSLSFKNCKVIERIPVDGLPPGWIREMRAKHVGGRLRKDPYFLHPSTDYEFRSRPDVLRYLDTGDIKNCAIIPKRREKNDMACVDEDSAPLSAADEQDPLHSSIMRELFPDDLAAAESKENQDNSVSVEVIGTLENHQNGTATGNDSKPGGDDSVAKAESAENGSVPTAELASGTRKSKNKSPTMPVVPGRSSKRLKGVEAEIKSDSLFSERAIRSAARGNPKQSEAEPKSNALSPGKESTDKPNVEYNEGKESELSFTLEDFSGFDLDPCLEFAVKTLTGGIPVEENLATHVGSQQP